MQEDVQEGSKRRIPEEEGIVSRPGQRIECCYGKQWESSLVSNPGRLWRLWREFPDDLQFHQLFGRAGKVFFRIGEVLAGSLALSRSLLADGLGLEEWLRNAMGQGSAVEY